MITLILNAILLFINGIIFEDLYELQTIYFENRLMEYFEIFSFVVLVSSIIFFIFYRGRIVTLLKRIFLFINVLLFILLIFLEILDEIAYDPEILVLPFIGLAIIKIKWTDEQLQSFFEEFQKEIEYTFTNFEKDILLKTATTPSELKENMLQKAFEATDSLCIWVTYIENLLDNPWVCAAASFCLSFVIVFGVIRPLAILLENAPAENIIAETVVEKISDGTFSSFTGFFGVAIKIVKHIWESFIG